MPDEMYVSAFFSNHGAPALGLTPHIDIWNITTTAHEVVAAPMDEVGGGFYKYHFPGYLEFSYACRCDGGLALGPSDRYKEGVNDCNPDFIAHSTWDEQLGEHITPNTFGEELQSKASQTSVNSVATAVSMLIQLETGHWKIHNHKLTFYDAMDNPIVVFKLFDENGNPTNLSVFDRVPE